MTVVIRFEHQNLFFFALGRNHCDIISIKLEPHIRFFKRNTKLSPKQRDHSIRLQNKMLYFLVLYFSLDFHFCCFVGIFFMCSTVFDAYGKLSGCDIEDSIEGETSGNLENLLLAVGKTWGQLSFCLKIFTQQKVKLPSVCAYYWNGCDGVLYFDEDVRSGEANTWQSVSLVISQESGSLKQMLFVCVLYKWSVVKRSRMNNSRQGNAGKVHLARYGNFWQDSYNQKRNPTVFHFTPTLFFVFHLQSNVSGMFQIISLDASISPWGYVA